MTPNRRLDADYVRDLLKPDGRDLPDGPRTGIAEALSGLDKELRLNVVGGLYVYAQERLDAAENAETRAKYLPPDDFRRHALERAEELALLWREATRAV